MPEVFKAQMNRGEITPYLHALPDNDLYSAGLAEAYNLVILRYGGVTRAPGTLYTGPVKSHAKRTVLRPFVFNRSQVYALEFGDLYLRFWTSGGRVEVLGSPVEVVTPYLEADLDNLEVCGSADVVYIFCKGYRLKVLTRLSETVWTLADYVSENGPYLPENETTTTLTPAATGRATELMTSNTAPSGVVTACAGATDPWKMFNGNIFDNVTIGSEGSGTAETGWFTYKLPTAKVVDAYWLTSCNYTRDVSCFQSWKFKGSTDGVTWETLDVQDKQSGWAASETRYFELNNKKAFTYYSFEWSGGGGFTDYRSTQLAECALHWAASNQTPFNLTASSVTGINGGNGFVASDVGRPIKLMGADGLWRWAVIQARTSSTVVTVVLHGQALPDASPIQRWRLGAWSDTTGWPAHGAFIEDRLAAARTNAAPRGVWASVNGDYDNHRVSQEVVDDDAISATLTITTAAMSGAFDEIQWIVGARNLIIGTASVLRSLGRADPGSALAPGNVMQYPDTLVEVGAVLPAVTGSAILFLDLFQRRLYEAVYSYDNNALGATEVSVMNEHLFAVGVDKIVFLSSPMPLLACLRADGKVIAFAYDREQKVVGGTLLDFGGVVEDIMSLPGAVGSELWMIVRRTINGSSVRYIERWAEFYREGVSTDAPVYAACAFRRVAPGSATLTGLGALEGETVGVWADGRDRGDFTVSGAAVTVGGVYDEVVIGKRMEMRGKTLRLASAAPNGAITGVGDPKNIGELAIDLFETGELDIGTLSAVEPVRRESDVLLDPDEALPLRTGSYPIPADDGWDNAGVVAFSTDSMYPVTVRAVTMTVEG